MKSKFEERLSKDLYRFMAMAIVLLIVIYFLGLRITMAFVTNSGLNRSIQSANLVLSNLYTEYDDLSTIYDKKDSAMKLFLDESIGIDELNHNYYSNNVAQLNKAEYVLFNGEGKMVATSFDDNKLSTRMINYNRIVLDNVKNETIYMSSDQPESNERYFIITNKLLDGNDTLGYVSFYINQKSVKQQLLQKNSNVVITDRFHRVVTSTNEEVISGNSITTPYELNSLRSSQSNMSVKESKSNISSFELIAFHQNIDIGNWYMMGFIIIVCVGFSTMAISRYYIAKIAARNSRSLSLLCDEVNLINTDYSDHKIELNTGDEFEILAKDINEMVVRISQLSKQNVELSYRSKLSELKQLEAQFNPHFLYNTLETIRYATLMGDEVASDLIIKLTTILRYSINSDSSEVRLSDDMKYLEAYCALQKFRYKDRFNYSFDIDERLNEIRVPKLFIQPLVENSIGHGFKSKENLDVDIKIEYSNQQVIILVKDNGEGMDEKSLVNLRAQLKSDIQKENQHGVYNTFRRLNLMYNERCSIEVDSKLGFGTSIKIIIPWRGE